MKSVHIDTGILPRSTLFPFTPSEVAKELYFYPIWCGHYFCTSGYFYKRESYGPLLLAYICDGTFHVEFDGRSFDAQAGDVVLLDCARPHYFHARDGLEFLFLHFDGSNSHALCGRILELFGPLIRNANNPLIGAELRRMLQFYEQGGVENMLDNSMRIYRLLHLLSEREPHHQREASVSEQAIRYIRSHVGQKISLTQLADLVGLSPYYFSRRFREETGVSPIEYVINTRLDQARVLLIRTSKSVEEIAYEVGYQNSSTLIRLFSQKVGMTPHAYRKQQV